MKDINNLINKVQQTDGSLSAEVLNHSTGNFTDYERKAITYVFMRIERIYGSKFRSRFAEQKDIDAAKREWAKDIGCYSRKQIDDGMDYIKNMVKQGEKRYEWPDIGLVIGAIGQSASWESQCHKPWKPDQLLVDKAAQERAKKVGSKTMKSLKDMF